MENSKKSLQGKSFKGQNLPAADFSGADLRGADFTGAVLTNANFSKCRTGLKTSSVVLVFIFALAISLLSGYFAMLTGATIQLMLKSPENGIVTAAYITLALILIFIVLIIWKGGFNTLILIVITIFSAVLAGLIFWLTGLGTGIGSLYASLALILFVIMVFVGITARATAGTLSSTIIYLIVAIGGSVFGKSLGGGIGTVVLAISCAVISKRVLAGKDDLPMIKKIALTVGSYFGTSFRNADLTGVDFSESVIKNTIFTGAKQSGIKWENSKKILNLEDV
jgi:hypothetical protein